MLTFAADENFNGDILRGLRRRAPALDIVRVQDTEMYAADDPAMLGWAAQVNRIVLTHDKSTVPGHAYERICAGERMPGVFIVFPDASIGQTIDDLLALALGSNENEWKNRVIYLPR